MSGNLQPILNNEVKDIEKLLLSESPPNSDSRPNWLSTTPNNVLWNMSRLIQKASRKISTRHNEASKIRVRKFFFPVVLLVLLDDRHTYIIVSTGPKVGKIHLFHRLLSTAYPETYKKAMTALNGIITNAFAANRQNLRQNNRPNRPNSPNAKRMRHNNTHHLRSIRTKVGVEELNRTKPIKHALQQHGMSIAGPNVTGPAGIVVEF